MPIIIFLSPSRQKNIMGIGEYGSEAKRMNELGNIIEAELERHGIYVEREGDEIKTDERVAIANGLNISAYISLHSNHSVVQTAGSEAGTELYVPSGNDASLNLAKSIFNEMKTVHGFIGKRGIRENDIFVETKLPKMPCCLIEVDFHDNYDRACWILENMTQIGLSITKGILNFFNMEYHPRTKPKYYRVQLGAFTDKHTAEKYALKLQSSGLPAVIKYY